MHRTKSSTNNSVTLRHVSLWRHVASLVILLSIVNAPLKGLAQTKEPDKRGIGTSSGSSQTSAPTPAAPGDRPELILQTGHTKSVNTVAFSPDNRWLASGGKDNVIKIWDLTNGKILRTLYGHSNNVNALAVSPDGKLLASGSGDIVDERDLRSIMEGGAVGAEDNTVRIWSIETGKELHTLRGHELPIAALAFSSDGHSLTSVSGDAVKTWDIAAGSEAASQKTKYAKSGLEKLNLSIFGGGKQQKQESQRLENSQLSASKIAVSANGQLAALGQPERAIKIYEAQTGREMRDLPIKAIADAENSSLAFSADARLIAFPKTRETVSVQETATGRELYSVNTGLSKALPRSQFSPDGRFLVTAIDTSAALKLWDAKTGQFIRELNNGGDPLAGSRVISFSSDGTLIATVSAGSKAIRIIEAATGRESRVLQTNVQDDRTKAEQAAFIKAIDPKTMATLQKRNITTPEEIVEAVEAMGTLSSEKLQAGHAVSFSPDGRFIISRQMILKNLLTEVWDSQTGTLVRPTDDATLQDRGKPFFSPDGRFRFARFFPMKSMYDPSAKSIFGFGAVKAFSSKQRVDLYDGHSDKHLRELDGGESPTMGLVPSAGFSFDGKLIAMTGFQKKDRVVLIYDTETGRKVNSFHINDDEQGGTVTTLCLSADEHVLAAAYASKIDLFDATTGRTIRTLSHAGGVTSLSFNPDGRFLVALGDNNDKYIWDTASGEQLATLVNLGGAVNSRGNDWLVVTPDGLFDGSPDAWKQILWQFGSKTFDVMPAETFFNEFYYPGLLGEVMAGKRPRAPKNISLLDRRQPEVKLVTQNSGTTSERKQLVKIEVTEKPADKDHPVGSGARDVRLFRNGSLVKVWRGDVLKQQTSTILEATITMVAGANRLTAYAFNRDNVKSADATLNLEGASSLKRSGTAYILAIGVNSYSNPQFNLKYAVADARDFGDEVGREQQRIANYGHVEVISLLDEEATKANILTAFRMLAGAGELTAPGATPAALQKLKATQPEDAVFIYFAGHGTAERQRFYLVPHDLGYEGERSKLDASGLQLIVEHGISDEELERAVEGIDAEKLLMVIDACNSGQALEATERRRGPMNSQGLAQLAYEKGMYILTAAQSYQAAQEVSQVGHGLLTYALVEEGLKLRAADLDPKDKEVWLREWFDYATTRVPNMQLEKLKTARGLGVTLSFVEGESQVPESERLLTQTPRVFYRREAEDRPLVVAKS